MLARRAAARAGACAAMALAPACGGVPALQALAAGAWGAGGGSRCSGSGVAGGQTDAGATRGFARGARRNTRTKARTHTDLILLELRRRDRAGAMELQEAACGVFGHYFNPSHVRTGRKELRKLMFQDKVTNWYADASTKHDPFFFSPDYEEYVGSACRGEPEALLLAPRHAALVKSRCCRVPSEGRRAPRSVTRALRATFTRSAWP